MRAAQDKPGVSGAAGGGASSDPASRCAKMKNCHQQSSPPPLDRTTQPAAHNWVQPYFKSSDPSGLSSAATSYVHYTRKPTSPGSLSSAQRGARCGAVENQLRRVTSQ
ncbi:unnamed protein product, partial [Pleuronectes platessa]